jgi:serine O-acetyltransferase
LPGFGTRDPNLYYILSMTNQNPNSLDRTLDLAGLAEKLSQAITADHFANIWESGCLPSRDAIVQLVDHLLSVLFPGVYGHEVVVEKDLTDYVRTSLHTIEKSLTRSIEMALNYENFITSEEKKIEPCAPSPENAEKAKQISQQFLMALPEIRKLLAQDLEAAYEGDPAASSVVEVLMSYPFIEAIATHRLAHVLYLSKVPLLPRMLSEVAHSRTGIDIHPGATIGAGFFIDHGTGVVIGETTVIGKGVKLYQGVTLGALSFPKDEDGNPIKGIKRHPNIEDHVTLYAGATVLGGQTTIGRGSIIGGNCWITASVPPDSLVLSEPTRRRDKE